MNTNDELGVRLSDLAEAKRRITEEKAQSQVEQIKVKTFGNWLKKVIDFL